MAVDKLVDSTQLDADLTSVANAIRTKGGTSAQLAFPTGFVSAVQAIPTGGGGSNTPVAEATITSVTVTSSNRSFDVTLSRAITKGIILFEPDASTKADIYADTTTTYYIVSLLAMFPVQFETAGTASLCTRFGVQNHRGSTGSFSNRGAGDTTAFNITISGTTLTVMWNISPLGNFFPGGTYKVTVWEVADS